MQKNILANKTWLFDHPRATPPSRKHIAVLSYCTPIFGRKLVRLENVKKFMHIYQRV